MNTEMRELTINELDAVSGAGEATKAAVAVIKALGTSPADAACPAGLFGIIAALTYCSI